MRTAEQVAAAKKKPRATESSRSVNGDPKLSENIAYLRAVHNLSLQEVGAEIGVTGDYINVLEDGCTMPSVAVLARLAAFYGVLLDDLAGHLVDAAKSGDPS